MERLTVLMTGPGGRIGPHLLPTFRERYDLRLLDKKPLEGEPDTILADLSDKDVLKSAMQGVDVVLHLAATATEAPFIEQLVPNNVVGVYNVFQAAHEAGVRRIVFASSVHTVGGYPDNIQIDVTDPVRPVTLYGVTKVTGEAMGRWYHDKHKMEFVAVRIGYFLDYDNPLLRQPETGPPDIHRSPRDIWLSPRDCAGILAAAIEKPGLTYHVVFATSITGRERLSRQPLREVLGYEPQDDVRTFFPEFYSETDG